MPCPILDARRHAGFSLLECLLACTLLTVGMLALAVLLASASSLAARARQITLAAMRAAQKLEELSSGRLTGDAEAVDYTTPSGERLPAGGGPAPPGTAFITRWSVRERGGGAGRTFVFTVAVESTRAGAGGVPDVRIVTARLRPAP